MLERHGELSTAGLISLSVAIALIGTAIFLLEKPVSPNVLVAFEHSLIGQIAF
jgi:hypothetical protein